MNTDVKAMAGGRKVLRAAAYVRKSTEDGLDQEYNSLDCQRDAIESYVRSQMANGWTLIDKLYSDPGYSGGNLDRPGVQELIKDVKAGLVACEGVRPAMAGRGGPAVPAAPAAQPSPIKVAFDWFHIK